MRRPQRPDGEEGAIARLLPYANTAEELTPEREARIRRAVEESWHSLLRARPARRRRVRLALAAAAALILALLLTSRGGQRSGVGEEPVAATVVRVVHDGGEANAEATGDLAAVVRVGRQIATDPATRMALALSGGSRLRMDRSTRLRFVAVDALELERGAVYLDSGEGGGRPVTVRVAGATVRELGTRYEVRLRPDGLEVKVRQGRVQVETDAGRLEAGVAERLVVGPAGARRDRVETFDPSWDWIIELADPVDFDGRTLGEFLAWLEAQTGWTVRFAPDSLEGAARAARLHGVLTGRRAEELMPEVMAACGLRYRLEGGVLVVGENAGGRGTPGER